MTEAVSADSSTAVPLLVQTNDVSVSEASVEETGTVKWYRRRQGFASLFGMAAEGTSLSTLQRSGITSLNAGQRVVVCVVQGRKGPEAGSIRINVPKEWMKSD